MRNVAAYLLAVLGGNTEPSVSDIKNILNSVGIEGDTNKIESLINELKGKDIHEVICAGREKMSAVPTGAVAVGGGGGGAAGVGGGEDGKAAEETKEEEKEEEKEESEDEDMGFSLFD